MDATQLNEESSSSPLLLPASDTPTDEKRQNDNGDHDILIHQHLQELFREPSEHLNGAFRVLLDLIREQANDQQKLKDELNADRTFFQNEVKSIREVNERSLNLAFQLKEEMQVLAYNVQGYDMHDANHSFEEDNEEEGSSLFLSLSASASASDGDGGDFLVGSPNNTSRNRICHIDSSHSNISDEDNVFTNFVEDEQHKHKLSGEDILLQDDEGTISSSSSHHISSLKTEKFDGNSLCNNPSKNSSNDGNGENEIGQVGTIYGDDSSRKTNCVVDEDVIALAKEHPAATDEIRHSPSTESMNSTASLVNESLEMKDPPNGKSSEINDDIPAPSSRPSPVATNESDASDHPSLDKPILSTKSNVASRPNSAVSNNSRVRFRPNEVFHQDSTVSSNSLRRNRNSICISRQKLEQNQTLAVRLERLESVQSELTSGISEARVATQLFERRLEDALARQQPSSICFKESPSFHVDTSENNISKITERISLLENFVLGFSPSERNESETEDNAKNAITDDEKDDAISNKGSEDNSIGAKYPDENDVKEMTDGIVGNEKVKELRDYLDSENAPSEESVKPSRSLSPAKGKWSMMNRLAALESFIGEFAPLVGGEFSPEKEQDVGKHEHEETNDEEYLQEKEVHTGVLYADNNERNINSLMIATGKEDASINHHHPGEVIRHLRDRQKEFAESINSLSLKLKDTNEGLATRVTKEVLEEEISRLKLLALSSSPKNSKGNHDDDEQSDEGNAFISEFYDRMVALDKSVAGMESEFKKYVSKTNLEEILSPLATFDDKESITNSLSDKVAQFKASLDEDLQALGKTKMEDHDVRKSVRASEAKLTAVFDSKVDEQELRSMDLLGKSLETFHHDMDGLRDHVEEMDEKLSDFVEANASMVPTPSTYSADDASLPQTTMTTSELEYRLKEAAEDIRTALESTFASKLGVISELQNKINVLTSQLADVPNPNQIDDMMRRIQDALSDRMKDNEHGTGNMLQQIIDNLKIELNKRLTKQEVISHVKKLLEEARLDIEREAHEAVSAETASLMIGRRQPTRCLGCDQLFANGVNPNQAHKTNHSALPSSGTLRPYRASMSLRPIRANAHGNNRHRRGKAAATLMHAKPKRNQFRRTWNGNKMAAATATAAPRPSALYNGSKDALVDYTKSRSN